jgi:hypothetical protein
MDQDFCFARTFKQQQQQQQQDAVDGFGPRRWSINASKGCTDASQQLPAVSPARLGYSKQGKDQVGAAGLGYSISLDCWDQHRSSSAASFGCKPSSKCGAARTACSSCAISTTTSTSSSSCYKAKSSAYSSSTYSSKWQAHSSTTITTSSSAPSSSRELPNPTSSSSSSDPLQHPRFCDKDLEVLKQLEDGSLAADTLEASLEQLPSLVQDTSRSTVLGCGSYGKPF